MTTVSTTQSEARPDRGRPDFDPLVDEILDLTDRRRVLLHLLLGVDTSPQEADEVFSITVDVTDKNPERT